MIPGADMFNHHPDRQSVQMMTDGDEHFVLKTVRPCDATCPCARVVTGDDGLLR